jgi:hypothetical protein
LSIRRSRRPWNRQHPRPLTTQRISGIYFYLVFRELLFSHLGHAAPIQTAVLHPRIHVRHHVCLQSYRQLNPLFRDRMTKFSIGYLTAPFTYPSLPEKSRNSRTCFESSSMTTAVASPFRPQKRIELQFKLSLSTWIQKLKTVLFDE